MIPASSILPLTTASSPHSSFSLHMAHIPLQLACLTLPLIHFTHIVYYFLYFVEKFLEPQDPGDFHRNNKFGKGLRAPHSPAQLHPWLTLEFLVSSCSFLWLAAELCGMPPGGLSGYLLWILAILHIHCCSVALVQQKRTEMGCVQGYEQSLSFFAHGVFFFLFLLQRLWPINRAKPRLSSWRHVGSELRLAFVLFPQPNLGTF